MLVLAYINIYKEIQHEKKFTKMEEKRPDALEMAKEKDEEREEKKAEEIGL